MLKRILEAPIAVPDVSEPDAAALILALMVRDPRARLGSGSEGTRKVMAHPFWAPLGSFDAVLARTCVPIWKPLEPEEAPPAAAERKEKEEQDEDDGEDEGDIDAETSDEDEDEDEWHQMLPSSGGGGDTGEMDELFRGFTFVRTTSYVPSSKDGEQPLTRSATMAKRRSQAADASELGAGLALNMRSKK